MRDLARARIEHLTKEIETVTTSMTTFRTRIGFTILVGPFIVMGSVLIATKGEVIIPESGSWLVGFALVVVGSYIGMAVWGGRYDRRMSDQCDDWREAIIELSKHQTSERIVTVRYRPERAYFYAFTLVLTAFLSTIGCLWCILPVRAPAWPGSVATFEQCKARLYERISTRQDVIAFAKEWNNGHYIDGDLDEAKFVKTNIDRILNEAQARNMLGQLETRLGVPADANARRINIVWTNRQSWIAISISGVALIVAVLALRRRASSELENATIPPADA